MFWCVFPTNIPQQEVVSAVGAERAANAEWLRHELARRKVHLAEQRRAALADATLCAENRARAALAAAERLVAHRCGQAGGWWG